MISAGDPGCAECGEPGRPDDSLCAIQAKPEPILFDTMEWAALCAERDREKADAVLRTRAAMAEPTPPTSA
jgi:hypothetical protein